MADMRPQVNPWAHARGAALQAAAILRSDTNPDDDQELGRLYALADKFSDYVLKAKEVRVGEYDGSEKWKF